MKNQFSSGNYNSWDELVSITLPSVNRSIRKDIIPLIDSTLISMLGYGSEEGIIKKSIDVSQIFEDNQISGVRFEIVYDVDEFQAPEAPKDAIDTDCETIKKAVSTDKIKATEVDIDVQKGIMKITFEILFEEYSNDQTGISE